MTDTFLEDIKRLEIATSLKTTSEYLGRRKLQPHKPIQSKQFKPSVAFKCFIVLFITGLLAMAIWGTFQPKKLTDNQIGGVLVAYLAVLILSINVYRQFFSDEAINYTIYIDSNGIKVNHILYRWDDIYATAIMKKTGGHSNYLFLVIAMKNQSTYESFDLTNLGGFYPFGLGLTLADYIEYFKPRTG